MTAPTFGMTFARPATEVVPALGADFSKILLIDTSEDASATEYPVEMPVRISSSDPDAVTALGTGLLADAVNGINDQLNSLNRGADVTIFRVAEGVDAAATAAAIATAIGSIETIPNAVNATPRIVVAGSTAYRADLDTTGPVIAALEANLGKLLAIAPVDVDDTSAANAIDARETMATERLMPIGVAARVYEGETLVTRPMAPRVAGLFARVDNEHQGKPFNPIANRAILGLAGLSRNIPFSLLDGSTEGQQMLEGDVSIVAQGETGVDGAIANGGFYFVGTDNATTGELWNQIHQVRGADYLTVKLMEITRQFLGQKITADLAEAWLNSMKNMLIGHQAADDILGFEVKFLKDQNTPENIRLGHLRVDLGIEPAPAFKRADHVVTRHRPAVDGLVNDIIARLEQANV